MSYEWDTGKADLNLSKHGIPFEYAVGVFLDPLRMERGDSRRDYGEDRWVATGTVDGRLLVVAYTRRAGAVRIISARRANERERRKYHGEVSP